MKVVERFRSVLTSAIILTLIFFMPFIGFLSFTADNAKANPDLSFLSTPTTEAYAYYKYDYEIIPSNSSANLTLYWTDATWTQLFIINYHLVGFPDEGDFGRVWMSLRLELMDTEYAWQNFTIDVVALDVMLAPNYDVILPILIAFIFCVLLLAVGFKEPGFWILAGPVWIICGLTIFITYGDVFLLASIGVGMVLFIEGVLGIANK
jgi:hypothetical protein